MSTTSGTYNLLEVLAEERVVDLDSVRGGCDFGHGGSVVAVEGGYKALGVLWHCTRAQREVRMRKVVVVRKVV